MAQEASYNEYGNIYEDDYSYEEGFLDNVSNVIGDLGYGIWMVLQVALIIVGILYAVYIVISLFTKGGKETVNEIAGIFKRIGRVLIMFRKWLGKILKNIWKRIISHKAWTAVIIIMLILLNFIGNVRNGESRILKYIDIENGFVGVDLQNEKILEPGYHIYSPLLGDFFLSKTSVFDFEIVAVTANTEEDMFVELDYRVGFKLVKTDLIDFYKKFGAKDMRTVASDVVMPRVLEALKGIIKEYSFKEISSKHNEIKKKAIVETNKILNEIGIEMNDINVLDIRLPESYTKSIEDLEKAENARKLAEAELEKEKKLSEKALIKAESNKEVKIIEAEGIAEYNDIVNSSSVTNQMMELKRVENEKLKIEKRDGKLPGTDDWWRFVELKKEWAAK